MSMKKLWALLLAAALCLSLAACDRSAVPADDPAAQLGTETPTGGGETHAENTVPIVPPALDAADAQGTPTSAADGGDVTCDITLTGDGADISGDGAALEGNVVRITAAGTYRLAGTLDEGQVRVSCTKDQKVALILAGVTVSCTTDAAIYVEEADAVTVTLAEGTENNLTGGVADTGAALYSKADLTLTGLGTLTADGANNAIHGKDDLTVESGVYALTAGNDALKGKDSVTVLGGVFTITAGGDGIQSDNDTESDKGVVTIENGSFAIGAQGDGVAAETALSISGGYFSVTTGGGAAAAPTHTGDQRMQWFGQTTAAADETSRKGLKAGTALTVTGGQFALDCYDDALHSNGDLTVSGGSFSIATGDDGFHADATLDLSGGTAQITRSYEGLEGLTILLSGGSWDVAASDDGFNAAGGDGSGGYGLSGMDRFSTGAGTLRITGGTLTVDAGGDGLDSNGDLLLEGGTVIVNGPTDSGNGALDSGSESGGVCAVTGGTLIAVGASGMAEGFDGTSTQCSFLQTLSAAVPAGSTVTVRDGAGAVLFTFTAAKSFNSVVFTAPALTVGGTYTLTAGDQTAEVTLTDIATGSGGGFQQGGGMGGHGGGGQRPDGFGGGTQPTLPGGTAPTMPDGTTPTPPDGVSAPTPPTTANP